MGGPRSSAGRGSTSLAPKWLPAKPVPLQDSRLARLPAASGQPSGAGGHRYGCKSDLILADEDFFFGEGEGLVADEDLVQAEDDGTWSGQLTVPADVDPDLSWFVSALCFAGPEAQEPLAFYEVVEFDVTGPPTTTPPTTPPATAPPPPEAPPAVPVVEEIFTG